MMLRALLKKQLYELNRHFFLDRKTGKRRSRKSAVLSIAGYALLVVGIVGGMFGSMAFGLCGIFAELGLDWLYFLLFSLIAVALGVFGSVFNTYASLYDAKDNDMLLAMPIPVRFIMFARLSGVYLMGLMFSGVVMIPAAVVYYITVPQTFATVLGTVLLTLLLSLFVLILSCALGWVVAKISAKLKNKSFVTVVVSVAFFGAYMYVCSQAENWIGALLESAAEVGAKIKGAAYPLYLLGRIGCGDSFAMLVWTAVTCVLLALVWLLLARSFLKLATSNAGSPAVRRRRARVRRRSPSAALFFRELRRFTSSPNYMLNCGMGTLFLPVGGVLLLVKGGELADALRLLPVDDGTTAVLLAAGCCLLSSMNNMTAASVSLEGKTLWLAQTLPVRPWEVLRAKISLHLLLTGVPALFCALCGVFALRASLFGSVLAILVTGLYLLLSAGVGLWTDLRKPNLTWTSEIVPIKQNMSVLWTLLAGWGFSGLLLAGGFLLSAYIRAELYLVLFAAVSGVPVFLLYRWLYRKGTRLFAELT